MQINIIKNTCSMVELGDLTRYSIEGLSCKIFRKAVNAKLEQQNKTDTYNKNYAILYNCSNFSLVKPLKKLGFKHVYTYTGSDDRRVKIFILEFDKKNWFQRLFKNI